MVLAGMVSAIRKRGQRGGFVAIEDHTDRMEVALFDETGTLYAEMLNKDEIIVVEGRVANDDFSGGIKMTAQKVMTLAEAKTHFAKGVQVALRGPDESVVSALQSAFMPYQSGSTPVWINYSNGRARARLELGSDWQLKACEELIAALNDLEQVSDARLVY